MPSDFHAPSPWLGPRVGTTVAPLPLPRAVARTHISVFKNNILVLEDSSRSLHTFCAYDEDSSMGSTTSQTTSLSALKSTNVRLEYKGCILAATSVKFQCLDQSASAAFCGGTDGACYMYGKRSSAWSRVLVHACPITALHVSGATGQSTANILATGSDRGGCAVYDVNTCMEVSRATPHEDAAVTWVRSLPRKAACFLSAAKDGKACLWDSRLTPSTRVVRQYECGAQPIHSAFR